MLDRSTPPPFVKAASFVLPGFHSLKTKSGIPVFLVSDVQQEVIKIEMVLNAGKWFETIRGVSHFASNMIEKGTTSFSSVQLAEAFDRLGAHIEITAGYDTTTLAIYSLSKNWKEGLQVFNEMVLHPTFPEEELSLMKGIFLQNLKVNLEKTSFVASQVIRKVVFGDHPYGTAIEASDVDKINTKQLAEFHKQHFTPFAIFVTAPASVSQQEILKGLEVLSAPGATTASEVVATPGVMREDAPRDGVQVTIRMGKRSLLRSDKNYPELLLFSHILGGYFGSRLMKNIREEKGLTYGIYSSINPFLRDSMFVIGADVNKENVDLALSEIRKEIKELRTTPIDSEELEIARNHFLGSLQSEVANPFSVTDKIRNIHLNRLPADYYQNLFKRIASMTPKDLMETGERFLHEDSLHVVTVG